MVLRTSLAARALTSVLGGILLVSVVSMGALYLVLERRLEAQIVDSGVALLDGLASESEESLAKGQRETFQTVLDTFAKLEEVEQTAVYSRSGLMSYRSGQATVGLPFVHEDGVFENPNTELHASSNGRFARADWELVDLVDSERAREHVAEKRGEDADCGECHYQLDPELELDEAGHAWRLEGEAPRFIERIPVTGDCLTCHTHWSVGEAAGYLEITLDTGPQVAAFQQSLFGFGVTLLILLATIVLLLLQVFRVQVGRPIAAIAGVFERAREQRDLGLRGDESRSDEIGHMAKSFNFLMGAMRSLFGEVRDISSVLSGASGSLETAFSSLSTGMSETRRRTEQATSTLSKMGGDIREVAGLTTEAERAVVDMSDATHAISDRSEHAAKRAEGAAANMTQVAVAVEQMSSTLAEVSQSGARASAASAAGQARRVEAQARLDELEALTGQVAQVVSVISGVADQTSLLALNATIEAASAGEAGRGFAVVAGEVKALAGQTARATVEIRDQVEAMQVAMRDVLQHIRGMAEQSEEVDAMTQSIAAAVEEQTAATREISERVVATSDAVTGVSGDVGEISARVRVVLERAQAVSEQIQQISGRADGLATAAEAVQGEVRSIGDSAERASGDCASVGSAATDMQNLVGRLEDATGQFRT